VRKKTRRKQEISSGSGSRVRNGENASITIGPRRNRIGHTWKSNGDGFMKKSDGSENGKRKVLRILCTIVTMMVPRYIGNGTARGNARVIVRRRAWAFPFIRCYYYYCYRGRTRPLASASPRRNPLISKVPIKGECRRDRCRVRLPPSYPRGKGSYNIIAFYLISALPAFTPSYHHPTTRPLCLPQRPIPLYCQPAAHHTNSKLYRASQPPPPTRDVRYCTSKRLWYLPST